MCAAMVQPTLLRVGGEHKYLFRVFWDAGNEAYATQAEESEWEEQTGAT